LKKVRQDSAFQKSKEVNETKTKYPATKVEKAFQINLKVFEIVLAYFSASYKNFFLIKYKSIKCCF